MGDAEGEHEAAAFIDGTGLCRCESESKIWTSCSDTRPARQEERQAQLCLARMPAVVPDTRPAPHRRGGKKTLKVIICMHAT